MTTLDKMLQGLANALGASLSTLTTTAKTVVGAINELKSGLTSANTNISTNTTKIGTGSLNTTSQTLIGAVNELKSNVDSLAGRDFTTAQILTPSGVTTSFTAYGDSSSRTYYVFIMPYDGFIYTTGSYSVNGVYPLKSNNTSFNGMPYAKLAMNSLVYIPKGTRFAVYKDMVDANKVYITA